MNGLAEFSREELFCVIRELEGKASGKTDKALFSSIRKLKRHWVLRYETFTPESERIKLRVIAEAFEEAKIAFPEDFGPVIVNFIKDPYRSSSYVELDVLFFRKGRLDDLPVYWAEIDGMARELAVRSMEEIGWVGSSLVRSIFEEELLSVLSENGLPIWVNPDHLTDMKLDPVNNTADMPVYAEMK